MKIIWPLIVKEKLGWWDVRVVVEHFEWPRVMFCSPWFCIVTTSQFPFHRIIAFLKKEVATCGAIFHGTTNKERALLNLLISIDVQPSHLIGTSKDGHRRSRTSKVTASPVYSPFHEFCHICYHFSRTVCRIHSVGHLHRMDDMWVCNNHLTVQWGFI